MSVLTYNIEEFDLLHVFLYEEITFDKKIETDLKETDVLLLIQNKIAACGNAISLQNYSEGSFTYMFSLNHITFEEERPSILNMPQDNIEFAFMETTTAFSYYHINAEEIYGNEVQKRKVIQKQNKLNNKLSSEKVSVGPPITESHIKAQYILKEIANIIGDDIHPFIAKNDQNRVYKDNYLFEGTITEIPNHPISKEWKNQASLIDVIWFKNHMPFKLFEIETSTTIASGLLRLSDYLSSINATNGEIYIITTKKRTKKLIKEINRPIFKRVGISQLCKVIFLEDLESLFSLVKLLKGHIKESVLDKITYTFEELEQKYE